MLFVDRRRCEYARLKLWGVVVVVGPIVSVNLALVAACFLMPGTPLVLFQDLLDERRCPELHRPVMEELTDVGCLM